MIRGQACIGIIGAKFACNIGAVARAGGCFGAKAILLEDCPATKNDLRGDTMKAHWHNLPIIKVDNLIESAPYKATIIAVEFIEGAMDIRDFTHPENAFYIFGGENRTLSSEVRECCTLTIRIPTQQCLNLAMSVNVVLYDRLTKERFNNGAQSRY